MKKVASSLMWGLMLACSRDAPLAADATSVDASSAPRRHAPPPEDPPLPPLVVVASEFKEYLACRADRDCVLSYVGCCSRGASVAIAADKLVAFRSRYDCAAVTRCPHAEDDEEPGSARCVEGLCALVGGTRPEKPRVKF